jgi:glycosyltransferase involved in cell wall biosynthesis
MFKYRNNKNYLALFFTRGISLEQWENLGLLDRELSMWEKYLATKYFTEIDLYTYGINDESVGISIFRGTVFEGKLNVRPMPRMFHSTIGIYIYSFLLPFIQFKYIRKCNMIKTNQMDGAWSAILSGFLFRIPVYLRTGFTLSQITHIAEPERRLKLFMINLLERLSFGMCDVGAVASEHNVRYLQKRNIKGVDIVPNFVDVHKFRITKKLPLRKNRLLFVGRFSPEKNLFNLINACAVLGVGLDIVGDGVLKTPLMNRVSEMGSDVNFLGTYKNSDLPKIFNEYKFYILPSISEGMPKTLLEAMACGCVCLGTDVTGINEVITSDVNGLLSQGILEADLIEVLERAFKTPDLQSLIENGTKEIAGKYSIEGVYNKELELFSRMVQR